MAVDNKRQTVCSAREEEIGDAASNRSPGMNKNEIQEAGR